MAINYASLDPRFNRVPLDTSTIPDVGEGVTTRAIGVAATVAAAPLSVIRRPAETKGLSGLSFEHRIEARDLAMGAAFLAAKNASVIHYTQGRLRWAGISGNLKALKRQHPHYADCSAFYTWCIWNSLDYFDVRDVVNGLGWRAGYTGTILTHGVRVRGELIRGDAVIYGRRYPGRHVAIYIGGGQVISHGSESGPSRRELHYRSDFYQARRFI